MKERKKLTASEKKELKARLKKSVWTLIHVVSYVLSIIAIILIAIGCSQSGSKAKAEAYTTTPIPSQPYSANLVDFKADDYYKSLPIDYSVKVKLPQYQDIATYFPSYNALYSYFEGLVNGDTWTNNEGQQIRLNEPIYIDEYTYSDIGLYCDTNSYIYYLIEGDNFDDRYDLFVVNSTGYMLPSFEDYSQLLNQSIEYNISNSIIKIDDTQAITGTLPQYIDRFYWWYLSTDTYKNSITLDYKNILNAIPYFNFDETLQNNAIVKSTTPLSSITTLSGLIYYNGVVYDRLVYKFSPVYKGSNSPYEIYTGGSYIVNSHSVQNSSLFAKCNDSAYSNYYYLESVSLKGAVGYNALTIFEVYSITSEPNNGNVFDDFFTMHYINASFFNNLIINSSFLIVDSISLYFLSFLPNFRNNDYLTKYTPTTIVGVFSGYVLPPISIDTNTTTDMFSSVFEWITFTFYGLMTILSFQILPSFSLGLILLVPFLFTILLFIVKLFKR